MEHLKRIPKFPLYGSAAQVIAYFQSYFQKMRVHQVDIHNTRYSESDAVVHVTLITSGKGDGVQLKGKYMYMYNVQTGHVRWQWGPQVPPVDIDVMEMMQRHEIVQQMTREMYTQLMQMEEAPSTQYTGTPIKTR